MTLLPSAPLLESQREAVGKAFALFVVGAERDTLPVAEACPRLGEIGRRNILELEAILAGEVGDIPQNVAKFLAHAIDEADMRGPVAQPFLIF